MLKQILNVNGVPTTVIVDPEATLADVLRSQLGLTGTKVGCGQGQCGACSVILNGKLVRSCVTSMKRVPAEASVITVEGIGSPAGPHPIQLALVAHGAAQCGFCMPGFVVSIKALLDGNPDPTRTDVRKWFQVHRNACRCNGYKVIVDAVMDAAKVMRGEMPREALEFTMPADGRIWGTSYPRPSGIAKVTGTIDYGADLGLKMPGDTLRLAFVQAKVPHANILGVDTSEAERMPGVHRVLTHKDVKGRNRIHVLTNIPGNKGDGWDRPILCDTKIFKMGDEIAIVCADTEQHARDAAEKVRVDLEVLPAYMSAPAAMAEDAMEIHPDTPNVYFEMKLDKGQDTKPILESAAYTVEGDFYLQRQPHLTIETDVAFGYYDEEGRVCVQSKSISIHDHVEMIAEGLGLPVDKVRIIQNPAGATFGYKSSPTMEALIAVAVMATGRPAYARYNEKQHIICTGKRSPVFISVKIGADENGKLVGVEYDATVDHGPYSELGDITTTKTAETVGAGYDIPNIRGELRTVCTNHAHGVPFRSFGSVESYLAFESLLDDLAAKVGMDPLELRYINVYRPGSTTPHGSPPEVFPFPEMFDMLRPKYRAAAQRTKLESTPEVKRGVGVALGIFPCGLGGPDNSSVEVELTSDGVTVYHAWEEHGQGADMGVLGTAHEALRPLGLVPTQIKQVANDTALVPKAGPAAASRMQIVTGNAIRVGCEQLMKAMLKPDGSYRTYAEMVAEGIPTRYKGNWTAPCSFTDEHHQGDLYVAYQYGVFMAEVAVDMKTGTTKVEKYTAVADMGKINNKLVVDGQLYGGIAQGIGLALTEDFEDVEKHVTLHSCGLPYVEDIPDDIELLYVQTPRKHGPFGASGAGELTLTAPHVAILNAIKDATGVRITHLPALPEKVLAGLKALQQ